MLRRNRFAQIRENFRERTRKRARRFDERLDRVIVRADLLRDKIGFIGHSRCSPKAKVACGKSKGKYQKAKGKSGIRMQSHLFSDF
jgi:hypothetical protein